ncbi:OsmC family protein [Myxococcota bacterium]|nr:OsmC family protein [Myxococcota bacterium]
MEMTITFGEGLKVNAEYEGRVIPTDQPVSAGGQGSAPEPYTLFLASIGTCAGVYVLSFLKNHGLPADGVRLVQKMIYDQANHRMARIDLRIVVPAGFPEKYRKALVRSAELCAVKRAIANPPEFTVEAVEP